MIKWYLIHRSFGLRVGGRVPLFKRREVMSIYPPKTTLWFSPNPIEVYRFLLYIKVQKFRINLFLFRPPLNGLTLAVKLRALGWSHPIAWKKRTDFQQIISRSFGYNFGSIYIYMRGVCIYILLRYRIFKLRFSSVRIRLRIFKARCTVCEKEIRLSTCNRGLTALMQGTGAHGYSLGFLRCPHGRQSLTPES